jgi:hypothetical protein
VDTVALTALLDEIVLFEPQTWSTPGTYTIILPKGNYKCTAKAGNSYQNTTIYATTTEQTGSVGVPGDPPPRVFDVTVGADGGVYYTTSAGSYTNNKGDVSLTLSGTSSSTTKTVYAYGSTTSNSILYSRTNTSTASGTAYPLVIEGYAAGSWYNIQTFEGLAAGNTASPVQYTSFITANTTQVRARWSGSVPNVSGISIQWTFINYYYASQTYVSGTTTYYPVKGQDSSVYHSGTPIVVSQIPGSYSYTSPLRSTTAGYVKIERI